MAEIASYFSSRYAAQTLGQTYTFKIGAHDTSYLHKVVIKCGSYSQTFNKVKADVATEYTIPLTWANAMPNSTSATGTMTLTTYKSNYSTKVGSDKVESVTFNLAATAAMPKVSVSVTDEDPDIPAKFGAFLQIKSKLKVVVTASGQYGATIKTYKTTLNGATYSTASFTTNALNYNGNYTLVTTVVDSRGKAMTTTASVKILPYAHPRIISFSTVRADAAGNPTTDGLYLLANANFAISNIDYLNDCSYTIEYKLKTDTSWNTMVSGSVYSLNQAIKSSGAVLSANKSYDTRLVIEDYFKEVVAIASVGTSFKLIHYNKNGKAMAFGKLSEKDEGVEFGIPTFFDRAPIFISESKILWSGALTMTNSERAELSMKISEQVHGVVLVFSRYSSGTVRDYHFNHFFVSKEFVKAMPGCGSSFLMTVDGNFAVMATKYLYIHDDLIGGKDINSSSGTGTSGVTYDNDGFVLRYVIGV